MNVLGTHQVVLYTPVAWASLMGRAEPPSSVGWSLTEPGWMTKHMGVFDALALFRGKGLFCTHQVVLYTPMARASFKL